MTGSRRVPGGDRSRWLSAGPAVLVVALALGLTGCGGATSTGVSSTVTQQAVTTSPPAPWDPAALEAVTALRGAQFVKAARAFDKCDVQTWSSSGPAPCRKKVAAETAVVDDFLADLSSNSLPVEKASLQSNLTQLSKSGAKVAVRCAKSNDQSCDKALTRFRADQQSVLWDLDASL